MHYPLELERALQLIRGLAALLTICALFIVIAHTSGCVRQVGFNPDYESVIAQTTTYPSFDPQFDQRELLTGCVWSWELPELRDDRNRILSRLEKEGLFDGEQYVMVEMGTSGWGPRYAYIFIGIERSRAILATNTIFIGSGKYKKVFREVEAAAARTLFNEIENARHNKWKDQLSQRLHHFGCEFITVKNKGDIYRFAAITPYKESSLAASPPAAIARHVFEFVDQQKPIGSDSEVSRPSVR